MKMSTHKKICVKILMLVILTISSACKKYLLIDPPIDQLATTLVFNNDDAAKSAITGIYSRMIFSGFASGDAISVATLTGLCADEFINLQTSSNEYYRNSLLPTQGASSFWVLPYNYIYSANAVLEGLDQTENVSKVVKDQLRGEAKFIRAFCYFYLTNIYGDVPLHLTTDYKINNHATRVKQSEIYQQIIKDLIDAQSLLTNDYYTTERVRPNKWAAMAMLARVYLYTEDWNNAETLSNLIIDNTTLFSLQSDLTKVFLKNSPEAIWQLMPNRPGLNTNEGNIYILTTTATTVSLTKYLTDAFEKDDKRFTTWVGSTTIANKLYHFAYKYKVSASSTLSEYSMVLRLAEQYLIRAEARIKLNKVDLGVQDLNILRSRARPTPTAANVNPIPALPLNLSQETALLAVEQERRVELFSEWGHRWLDLKRTKRAQVLLPFIKGTDWQDTDVLFPIPQDEINVNPLIIQNEGY